MESVFTCTSSNQAAAPVPADTRELAAVGRAYNQIFRDLSQDAQNCFTKAGEKGEVVIVSHNADHSVRGIATHKVEQYQAGRLAAPTKAIAVQDLFEKNAREPDSLRPPVDQTTTLDDRLRMDHPRDIHDEPPLL